MPQKLTRKVFIARAHKKHYGKYNYTKSVYTNYDTKTTIICKIHGEFLQTPHDHLAGYGCPTCGKSKKLDTASFIDKAQQVHKGKYTYEQVNYVNSKTKVAITCREHGVFFQVPACHLSGRGCLRCTAIKSYFDFVPKADIIHNKKYTYIPPTHYAFNKAIGIVCPIHGVFYQKPTYHLSGRGCSSCAKSGYDVNKPGTLYYIRIKGTGYYKIGITNNTIKKRFSKEDLSTIEVIRTWYYENGQECYNKEQEILQRYKSNRCYTVNLLQSGNTELFNTDILALDILL